MSVVVYFSPRANIVSVSLLVLLFSSRLFTYDLILSIYCRANTLLVFLYSIILESSYSLYDRAFADNIGTVLFYAVIVSFCVPFLSSSFRHGEGLTNIDWATISSLDRSFFRVARVFYLVLQKSLGPNVPYPFPGEMPCITVHLCVSRLDILYVSTLLRLCVCVYELAMPWPTTADKSNSSEPYRSSGASAGDQQFKVGGIVPANYTIHGIGRTTGDHWRTNSLRLDSPAIFYWLCWRRRPKAALPCWRYF